MKNKVPYNLFHKWYKDTRKKVVAVQVDGFPASGEEAKPTVAPIEPQSPPDASVRIWIELRVSNGLHLSRKNLSYQELVLMVEKLEVLC